MGLAKARPKLGLMVTCVTYLVVANQLQSKQIFFLYFLYKQTFPVPANQDESAMVISTKEPSLHSKPDKQKQVINKTAGEKQVIYGNASVILRVASLLYLHYNSISIGI